MNLSNILSYTYGLRRLIDNVYFLLFCTRYTLYNRKLNNEWLVV